MKKNRDRNTKQNRLSYTNTTLHPYILLETSIHQVHNTSTPIVKVAMWAPGKAGLFFEGIKGKLELLR